MKRITSQRPRPVSHPLDAQGGSSPQRKVWIPPEITQLPRLSELTLQTNGIPGGGGTGGGGSTVVP